MRNIVNAAINGTDEELQASISAYNNLGNAGIEDEKQTEVKPLINEAGEAEKVESATSEKTNQNESKPEVNQIISKMSEPISEKAASRRTTTCARNTSHK